LTARRYNIFEASDRAKKHPKVVRHTKLCGVEGKMTSEKISVRLDSQLYQKVRDRCKEAGFDITSIARNALESYLADRSEENLDESDAGLVPPDQIYSRLGPYFAYSGDLKKKLHDQYLELMTIAYAAQKHFPRSRGVKEIYGGLLKLSKYFDLSSDVGRNGESIAFGQFKPPISTQTE
jgi:hypothetical protein